MNRKQKAQLRAQVVTLLQSGLTRQEVSEKSGFSMGYVSLIASQAGLAAKRPQYIRKSTFRYSGPLPDDFREDRTKQMADLYADGKTLEEVGAKFGVTRERVRQLIGEVGMAGSDGGRTVRAERRTKVMRKRQDTVCMAKYGCTFEQHQEILKANAGRAYSSQRMSAFKRGIAWNMTMWEWWTLWRDSGKWNERGRGATKYCMGRKDDHGAYQWGNVKIVTGSQNASEIDGNLRKKGLPTRAASRAAKAKSA